MIDESSIKCVIRDELRQACILNNYHLDGGTQDLYEALKPYFGESQKAQPDVERVREALSSFRPDPQYSGADLSDYLEPNVMDELAKHVTAATQGGEGDL